MSLNSKKNKKLSIVDWCDQQTKNGNKLSIHWEGGGDSGWVYFEIDGENVENKYTEALVDYIYDQLNYGSWAGDFNANGEAVYDEKTKQFEGTDYYGEDQNNVLNANIQLAISKDLWFDTVHVEVECNNDETPEVSVRLIVKNGFLTPQHSEICTILEQKLEKEFSELFDNYSSTDGSDFRGCTDSWNLDRMGGEEQPNGKLLFTISKVDVQTISNEERDIVMDLTDESTLEYINNRLNSNNE